MEIKSTPVFAIARTVFKFTPPLASVLARLPTNFTAARILAYHICDWLVPTRDLLNDRGMMGDGVIDLPRIRSLVEAAGYTGLHEVEIFSERDWWQRDPDDVLRTMKERHQRAS